MATLLVGGLLVPALSWTEVLFVLGVGNAILGVLMVLMGHIGVDHGVSASVISRVFLAHPHGTLLCSMALEENSRALYSHTVNWVAWGVVVVGTAVAALTPDYLLAPVVSVTVSAGLYWFLMGRFYPRHFQHKERPNPAIERTAR